MTINDIKPGDLVEDIKGGRWIVGGYTLWSHGSHVHAVPATKLGKPDKRYDGLYLDPSRLKLISRPEAK